MADASIYQNFLRPIRSAADFSNELDRSEANALHLAAGRRTGALQEQAMAQQMSERNALQRLAQQHAGNQEGLIGGLESSGMPGLMAQGQAMRTQQLNRAKTEADVGKTGAETAGLKQKNSEAMRKDAVQQAASFASPQDAIESMSQAVRDGKMPMQVAAALQRMVSSDPQWQLRLVLGANTPEKMTEFLMPHLQTVNAGGFSVNQAVNKMTGAPTETGRTAITQSADNRATQQTAMRGQNMIDARTRDANEQSRQHGRVVLDSDRGLLINTQTGLARPFVGIDGQAVGAKDKGLNDVQSKALLFGTRMQEADKILSTLSKAGSDQSGMIKRATESTLGVVPFIGDKLADAGGALTNWTQSDEQQQVEQAKRDFINGVLRRESGAAIGADEFVSADKQYFPAPGDSEAVKAQKARNRKLATEGILAEVPQNKRTSITPKATGSVLKFDANGNMVTQ